VISICSNAEPDPFAAHGCESMNVVLAAIDRAGTRIAPQFATHSLTTRDYDGILARWSFTSTGGTSLARMSVRLVGNGK
jgi:hypothetical protein